MKKARTNFLKKLEESKSGQMDDKTEQNKKIEASTGENGEDGTAIGQEVKVQEKKGRKTKNNTKNADEETVGTTIAAETQKPGKGTGPKKKESKNEIKAEVDGPKEEDEDKINTNLKKKRSRASKTNVKEDEQNEVDGNVITKNSSKEMAKEAEEEKPKKRAKKEKVSSQGEEKLDQMDIEKNEVVASGELPNEEPIKIQPKKKASKAKTKTLKPEEEKDRKESSNAEAKSEENKNKINEDKTTTSKPKKGGKNPKTPKKETKEMEDEMTPINIAKIQQKDGEVDEIDKLLDEAKKDKPKKSWVKSPKAKVTNNADFPIKSTPKIINLEDVNSHPVITNSEIIFSLMEIAINSSSYEIGYMNKSRLFWEEVGKKEQYKRIFGNYKGETLRKYWRIIDEAGNIEKILETLRISKNEVDNPTHKLLTIITCAKDHVLGKVPNFEEQLKSSLSFGTPHHSKSKPEQVDDMLSEVKKVLEGENNHVIAKRSHSAKIPDTKKIFSGSNYQGKIQEKSPDKSNAVIDNDELIDVLEGKEDFVPENTGFDLGKNYFLTKLSTKPDLKHESTEEDMHKFNVIDALMVELHNLYPKYTKEFLLESLRINSFNLQNAIEFLENPSENRDKTFTEVEDYIISSMKDSTLYAKITQSKGENNVQEREAFLKPLLNN